MDAKDVEVITKKKCFQGYFSIDEYILKHRSFKVAGLERSTVRF